MLIRRTKIAKKNGLPKLKCVLRKNLPFFHLKAMFLTIQNMFFMDFVLIHRYQYLY